MGIKEKYAWNRYIGPLIEETQNIPPGFQRNKVRLRKGLKILFEHRFNLWDYQSDISQMNQNGNVYTFQKEGKDIHLYLPDYTHDYIQRRIVTYGDFYEAGELEELNKEVSFQNAVILDIGANIGNHSAYWGRVKGAKRIYSYEPVAGTYEILKRNIELNSLRDVVTACNVALGSESGRADIKFWDPNNCGKAQISPSDKGDMKISRLDDYTFEKIDFIKIDVESFEYELLLGAKKTLTQHTPKIFIEIFEEQFERVNRLLEEYGYKMNRELSKYNYLYEKNIDN